MSGPEAVTIIAFTAIVSGGLTSIIKVIVGSRDRRRLESPVSSAAEARLERIEQAVEGIALEVERVAEAQRFTTRLLSERSPSPESRTEIKS